MAGIELGRRVAQNSAGQTRRHDRITGSDDAIAFCRDHFARLASDAAQEEFHIASLDSQYRLIATHRISVGSLDRSLVHPREVFRPAIKDAAKSVLLMHNHPSGDPTPSEDDLVVTGRLEDAGHTLGINVLDHIVVARDGAASIREFRGSKSRSAKACNTSVSRTGWPRAPIQKQPEGSRPRLRLHFPLCRVVVAKVVLFDEAVQGSPADSQGLGGMHLVALDLPEHFLDMTSLHLAEMTGIAA